jgi:fructose-1,6-bisphosphatase/inositol monophosphatase family enzyme
VPITDAMRGEPLADFLDAAVDAARLAGAVIRDGAARRASIVIERKTINDFVSIVDQSAERAGLAEAIVGTGLPYRNWGYLDDYMASLREIMQRCAGVRRPGAAALDLAYVSAGWTDGHWERDLNAWDVGAASLLVEEAGGVVSTFAGDAGFLDSGHIVVGTPGVHAELLGVLARYPALAA